MPASDELLSGLTPPQREAVTHVEGPLLIVAGAGSGKTRVITRRVAYLALQGVPPYRILAVTFTNKAADEMRERIEQLAGTSGAWVSTFHSLCAAMLRFSADDIGLPRGFTIYDRDDQLKLVKEALHTLDLDTSILQPANALQAISHAKQDLCSPQEVTAATWREELIAKVYAEYQRLLGRNAALDFDDLLMRVAELLERDEAFRERWQRRFQFLLIDEYQDTNRAQHLIAKALAGKHHNICATGDPDQSIYGWRGATIRNILDLQRDYPKLRTVKLEQNFRSTKTILRAADSVITHNALRIERGLWTENEEGAPVHFLVGDDPDDEAERVLSAIRSRMAQGRRWRDFAIFYRTNAQSRSFEEAMVEESVPHRLVGAVAFYSRKEIKDVLAYLRVCLNERDALSLERIINTPSRGVGERTIERLKHWAEESGVPLHAALASVGQIADIGPKARGAVKAFAELLDGFRSRPQRPVKEFCESVLKQSGYQAWLEEPENEERLENANEFLAKAAKFDAERPEEGLAEFMQDVSLVSDVDNLDPSAEAISLMTLHSAKGLEFPVVFLTGMEENLLPHANSMDSDEEIEEERRLCYVGMTRAQKELILTVARQRAQGRTEWSREPSRFLSEIAPSALDKAGQRALARFASSSSWMDDDAAEAADDEEEAPAARLPRRKPRAAPEAPRTACPFAVGDRVRHPQYGAGRIVAIQRSEKMTLVTLSMTGGGKRVFALEYVQLEKL
jgi:DNA helicase-2/ATP-dependent DNA helicase PcrA